MSTCLAILVFSTRTLLYCTLYRIEIKTVCQKKKTIRTRQRHLSGINVIYTVVRSLPTGSPLGLKSSGREELERAKKRYPPPPAFLHNSPQLFRARYFPKKRSGEPVGRQRFSRMYGMCKMGREFSATMNPNDPSKP